MRFEIIGKNISVTDAMREAIEKKLNGLDKYLLIDKDTVARVVVRVYPNTDKIEVTIPAKVGILRAEVEHDDLYAAIDLAVDKLEDQIRRQKTRLTRRHKDSLAQSFLLEIENEEEKDIPVKTKGTVISKETSEKVLSMMESVVSEGTRKKCKSCRI